MKTPINNLMTVLLVMLASSANAYQVITDRTLFAESFENPTDLLDFSHLKDGTVFATNGYFASSPLIFSYSRYYASVREEAWADGIFIGSTWPNCHCAWTATDWYGDHISPAGHGYYNFIYLHTGRESMPVTFETSVGFLGYIPDDSADSYYLLPNFASVMSVRYGYSAVPAAPVVSDLPEPGTSALVALGLGAILSTKRRRRK